MKARNIAILRLIINTYLPVTFEYLANEFKVSTRTIRNEIDIINDFLTKNGFNEINNDRDKGLVLNVSDQEKIELEKLISKITEYYSREERILDIILDVALSDDQVYLYKKEIEFEVSKSTIDEDMRKLRNIINEYNIEMVSVPKKGLILKGNERNIRAMIFSIINKYSEGFRFLDNGTNISSILKKYIYDDYYCIVDDIFDKWISSTIEDIYRKNFILLICIWIIRNKLGHRLENEDFEFEYFENKNLIAINQFINKTCEVFSLTPPAEEIKYIEFMLQSLYTFDKQKSFDWMRSQIITIELIQFVEENTKIPFSRKESTLQSGIYYHLRSMIPRVQSNLQFSNPLTSTIIETYGDVFSAIKKYFSSMHDLTHNEVSDDEIAFLTIHFSAAMSELKQKRDSWFRVAVVCNQGVATGKLLSENLQALFNIEVIGVFSSRELATVEKLDIDLVFSTISIDYTAHPYLKIEAIISDNQKDLINRFLEFNSNRKRKKLKEDNYTKMFQDISKLIENNQNVFSENFYKELESIFTKNHLKINKKEIQPMIKDILLDSDVLLNVEVNNWEEAIVVSSKPLLERNVITQNYVKAMIDSVKEYGPYIVIGPHFALAHARPEDGANEIGLSIATLKKPVEFGSEDNDPVSLVFCLSAVDSYSHLNIMKEIINLINDPDKILDLVEVDNLKEFKEKLF